MKKLILYTIIPAIFALSSCTKSDFLDARTSSSIVIPEKLSDLQAMLDYTLSNSGSMNRGTHIGASSSDIFFMTDNTYASSTSVVDKAAYTWETDTWVGQGNQANWNLPFNQIYKANLVLEMVDKIADTSQFQKNYIKAQALFFRAYAYFDLAQVFCPYYDPSTASSQVGLPLRLSSDINTVVQRSNLAETFNLIFNDLAECQKIMNVNDPGTVKNRPSRAAVFALLSRIHLYARSYKLAGDYADSSLAYYNKLVDFNSLSTTVNSPFTSSNDESIFLSIMGISASTIATLGIFASIDTTLYRSYDNNDLRKTVYFVFPIAASGLIQRKVDRSGVNVPFGGLGVHELYFIKAECQARAGNITGSMATLNTIVKKRWKSSVTYPNIIATTSADALNKVLIERKKDLLFTQRWADLRRLNAEGANITLTRVLNNKTYTLPANSPLYVFPIPPDEISLSGIQQNPR